MKLGSIHLLNAGDKSLHKTKAIGIVLEASFICCCAETGRSISISNLDKDEYITLGPEY